MRSARVILGAFLLVLLAGVSSLVSQQKNPPPKNSYAYEQANEQTVRGLVVETKDFQCPVTGAIGSHITVKSDQGPVEVHLAPASFMKQYEINIRKDQNVTVIGSQITFEGKTQLVAKSVIIGRDTYNFRDAKGRPLW